jgi:SAM-dependent methyltransferase
MSSRVAIALACAAALLGLPPAVPAGQRRTPDIHFVPSPPQIVTAMLQLAGVTPDDRVYDLGSGDGRIAIAAARDFGARAVGIELDPDLVARAREAAEAAGVADRVRFIEGDLFAADVADATVVTLYLLTSINERLMPKLARELRPGARVVSHQFRMGEWVPDRETAVEGRPVYLWVLTPGRVAR